MGKRQSLGMTVSLGQFYSGGASSEEPTCQRRRCVRDTGLMATCPSIPAWKSPWTEEPGGLACIGPQRIGHD